MGKGRDEEKKMGWEGEGREGKGENDLTLFQYCTPCRKLLSMPLVINTACAAWRLELFNVPDVQRCQSRMR